MIVMFLTDNCSSHMNKTHINYEQIKINEKDLFKLIAKFANKHNMTVSIKLEKNVEAGLGLRMGNIFYISFSLCCQDLFLFKLFLFDTASH